MDAVSWLAVAAGAVVVAVVADRVVARLPQRTRTRERRPGGGGAGAFGELVAGFQPGVRHLQDEQERQRHDLVLPGDADKPWGLDLDAGTVELPAASSRAAGDARGGGAPGLPRAGGHGPTEVAPGVWTWTAVRWSTTTTAVVDPDGRCLLVDPGLTVAELDAVARDIQERGWEVVAGFSTHPHWDHVLWHASWAGVPRWATPAAVRTASARRVALLAQADADAPGHDPALVGRLTALPDGAAELAWAGARRVVVVPYAGHCAGSAALVVPDVGVVVAGDVLSDREVPLLDLSGPDPAGTYAATLDTLEAVIERWDVRVLVPGHGAPTDGAGLRTRLAADRAYLDALTTAAEVSDPRLADPEQAAQHREQHALLRRHGG